MPTGSQNCPICDSPLSRDPEHVEPYADVKLFSCTRCGGYYLSGLLQTQLPSVGRAERLALSRFIRLRNDHTGGPYREPLIPGNFAERVAAGRPAEGPTAKVDELLRMVAGRTSDLGDQTEPESGLVWAARLGLPSERHFELLAEQAKLSGVLDHAIRPGVGYVLGLTMHGWRMAEALRSRARGEGGQRGGDFNIWAGDGGPDGERGGDIVIRAGDGGPGGRRGGDVHVRAGDGAPAAIEPERLHPSLTPQALHLMAATGVASPAAPTSRPTSTSNSSSGEPMSATKPPKAFISYSWDSEEHKAWVKGLAGRLRADGVDVVLDQWHLALGDQLPQFMETAVSDSGFVVLVCTRGFKAKADGRKGGVGYEGHIITAEVFRGASQRKFVPVLREGAWDDAAPSWLAGKLAADLRGDPFQEPEYQRLLAHLHDDRDVPPPVGTYVRRNPPPNPR